MAQARKLRVGEVFDSYQDGTKMPYFYVGRGEVCGTEAEMFVEAPNHFVDSSKEIKVIGIRGDLSFREDELPQGTLPSVAETFSPNTPEHSQLVKKLEKND